MNMLPTEASSIVSKSPKQSKILKFFLIRIMSSVYVVVSATALNPRVTLEIQLLALFRLCTDFSHHLRILNHTTLSTHMASCEHANVLQL